MQYVYYFARSVSNTNWSLLGVKHLISPELAGRDGMHQLIA